MFVQLPKQTKSCVHLHGNHDMSKNYSHPQLIGPLVKIDILPGVTINGQSSV